MHLFLLPAASCFEGVQPLRRWNKNINQRNKICQFFSNLGNFCANLSKHTTAALVDNR